MTGTTSFFIENATTGRFHRHKPISENAKGKEDNDKNNTSISTTFHRYVIITFLFLQGILSGLCLSALYEAFNNNASFVSSQTTSEQYFFVGILGGVFVSWYMLHQDIITQLKERNCLDNVSKSLVAKNLIFFLAFIFTYMCSNLVFSGTVDENNYRNFAIARSILCILGWLISCYRFVVTRSNNTVQPDEKD